MLPRCCSLVQEKINRHYGPGRLCLVDYRLRRGNVICFLVAVLLCSYATAYYLFVFRPSVPIVVDTGMVMYTISDTARQDKVVTEKRKTASRTEQNRTEQNRTEQNRAEQSSGCGRLFLLFALCICVRKSRQSSEC